MPAFGKFIRVAGRQYKKFSGNVPGGKSFSGLYESVERLPGRLLKTKSLHEGRVTKGLQRPAEKKVAKSYPKGEIRVRPRDTSFRKLDKFARLPRRKGEYAPRRKGEYPHTSPDKASFMANTIAKQSRRNAGEPPQRWWRERSEPSVISGVRTTEGHGRSFVPARGADKPKPKLNISKQQWKLLLDRVTVREGKGGRFKTQKLEDFVMSRKPPETQVMGRLHEPLMQDGMRLGSKPKDYPFQNAGEKYAQLKEKGKFVQGNEYVPPTDIMSFKGGEPSYKRQVWKPISDTAERADVLAKEVQRKPLETLEQRGQKAIAKVKGKGWGSTEELRKIAMLGDKVWKHIGGGRTITGKFWKRLADKSRAKDPRNYFMKSFLQWQKSPEQYAVKHKPEAKSLEVIWEQFMKDYPK
jgi:hypothetical protein